MIVNNKEQIFEQLGKNREALSKLGVSRVGVFGSFVRSEQNDDSDVDLLVDFAAEQKSFENFMNLAFLLEEVFGRKVDLVTLESLSPYIGPRILAEVEYGVID